METTRVLDKGRYLSYWPLRNGILYQRICLIHMYRPPILFDIGRKIAVSLVLLHFLISQFRTLEANESTHILSPWLFDFQDHLTASISSMIGHREQWENREKNYWKRRGSMWPTLWGNVLSFNLHLLNLNCVLNIVALFLLKRVRVQGIPFLNHILNACIFWNSVISNCYLILDLKSWCQCSLINLRIEWEGNQR